MGLWIALHSTHRPTNRISGICSGTPLTLSNPEAGRSRVEVQIDKRFDVYLNA